MKLFKITIISLLLIIGNICHAKTLVWATEATYPPFVSTNPQGKIVGMDADIAHVICKQMKVQCQFVNTPWDSLIPGVKLGKYDIAWGGMNITPARAKQVNFTEAYYVAPAEMIASKKENLTLKPASLSNKTIATQKGNTFQQYLKQTYGDHVKIKLYDSVEQAFTDLQNGRVDAVMTDQPTADAWLKKDNNNQTFTMVGQPIKSKKYFDGGYGIAVAKDNQQLLNKLNQAIKVLQQQGKIKAIIKQHMS